MPDIMVDLETMSLRPNAAPLAIGAVVMRPDGRLGETFYATIDLKSSVKAGGHFDPDTVAWWLQQDHSARASLANGSSEAEVLRAFSAYLARRTREAPETGPVRIWGNGAAFDNVVLTEAYRRHELLLPWSHRNDRCYRTLAAAFPNIECDWQGVAHHALHDAENQARHLLTIFKEYPELNPWGPEVDRD